MHSPWMLPTGTAGLKQATFEVFNNRKGILSDDGDDIPVVSATAAREYRAASQRYPQRLRRRLRLPHPWPYCVIFCCFWV